MKPRSRNPAPKPGAGLRLPPIARSHFRLGWWYVLTFAALGLALEILHGVKADSYLSASNETRRLMWTLAHTHGTLLGMLQIGFAVSLSFLGGWTGRTRTLASRCLHAASVLMPLGFFLGGLFIHGGDPGIGVFLVAPGAALLLIAIFLTALHARDASTSG